jgi:glycosyltransferase involved in cell wall biosynthesis
MATVAVVIPTFNRRDFVVPAIESVLAQRFRDFELVVVDDGSTDGTEEALRRFARQIHYVRQPNAGVSAARNTGIRRSSSEWVAFLDSDDEWDPDYLGAQLAAARSDRHLAMQTANCRFIAVDGTTTDYFSMSGAERLFRGADTFDVPRPFAFVVERGPWQIGATIVRRDALVQAGLFDETLTLGEDLELMARVARYGSFRLIRRELVNVFRRVEQSPSLTLQYEANPVRWRDALARMHVNLSRVPDLAARDRRVLDRVMSANQRAMGNVRLAHGDERGALDCYRRAVSLSPSFRSVGKLVGFYASRHAWRSAAS